MNLELGDGWQSLLQASINNKHEASHAARRAFEAFIDTERSFRNGYTVETFVDLLTGVLDPHEGSMTQKCRRRQQELGEEDIHSPHASTLFRRIEHLTEETVMKPANHVAIACLEEAAHHLQGCKAFLVIDEFCIPTASESIHHPRRKPRTESGNRATWTKQGIELIKKTDQRVYRDFADQGLIGHWYVIAYVVLETGQRFPIHVISQPRSISNAAVVQAFRAPMERVSRIPGLDIEGLTVDRRWDDVKSCKVGKAMTHELGLPWINRAKITTTRGRPGGQTQKLFKRWQNGVTKDVPRAALVHYGFQEAEPFPGRPNESIFYGTARPFKQDSVEMTQVVHYKPKKNHRIRKGAKLRTGTNMDAFLLTSSCEPTLEEACKSAELAELRWEVEHGIKETKQFLPNIPGGWTMRNRLLGLAMSIIMQNVATVGWMIRNRRLEIAGRRIVRFLKDAANDLASNLLDWARKLVGSAEQE